MNEILRDRERSTVRLVMNPDKMVIGEAMRTFTYLNLYGYLTDAVIVNRVFPEDVGDYFAGWRKVQEEHLELVRSAFAPVPVLCAPYFDQEVVGAEMLDRLADALFDRAPPTRRRRRSSTRRRCCTTRSPRSLTSADGEARLRVALPFTAKADVKLKKIGLELIVAVDGQKRTIMLPDALAGYPPHRRHARGRRAGGDVRWPMSPARRAAPARAAAERAPRTRAERLIAEAARTAAGKPPPAGLAAGRTPSDERRGSELDVLIQAFQSLRELIPPEVLQRLADGAKELLLAIRALIDWYLERVERRRAEAAPRSRTSRSPRERLTGASARAVNEHSIRLTPWMKKLDANISGGPASMSGIVRSSSANSERSWVRASDAPRQ